MAANHSKPTPYIKHNILARHYALCYLATRDFNRLRSYGTEAFAFPFN